MTALARQKGTHMKKLLTLVLAAVMVLSMAACGGKTEAPATTAAPAALTV